MTTAVARDTQQSAVYNAEHLYAKLLDRGAGTSIELAGTTLTPPAEAKFGDIAAIQRYVDSALARPSLIARYGPMPPVTVRARRGNRAAHYEPGANTIAVPIGRDSRALRREAVVVHELAHHIDEHTAETQLDAPAHGPQFAAIHVWVAEDLMGPEAGFMLRVLYSNSGVAIG